MKTVFLLFVLLINVCRASSDSPEVTSEQLIDQLREIDTPTVGLHPTAWTSKFLALSDDPTFQGGVLGSVKPVVFPAMRELVRRGVAALPALLAHLDDARPTKLTIKEEGVISWARISNGYNNRPLRGTQSTPYIERPLDLPYQVRVGDVCLVILGQITNRPQVGVRYQPTGGVAISSPVVFPDIAKEAREDWRNTTAGDLCALLLSDISESKFDSEEEGALERIRFYFPERLAEAKELMKKKANQALLPTPTSVTDRAAHAPRQP